MEYICNKKQQEMQHGVSTLERKHIRKKMATVSNETGAELHTGYHCVNNLLHTLSQACPSSFLLASSMGY